MVADAPRGTIALEREAITTYLDAAIGAWRHLRDEGPLMGRESASYYVDCLQGVRIALLGEALPSPLPPSPIHWAYLMSMGTESRHD